MWTQIVANSLANVYFTIFNISTNFAGFLFIYLSFETAFILLFLFMKEHFSFAAALLLWSHTVCYEIIREFLILIISALKTPTSILNKTFEHLRGQTTIRKVIYMTNFLLWIGKSLLFALVSIQDFLIASINSVIKLPAEIKTFKSIYQTIKTSGFFVKSVGVQAGLKLKIKQFKLKLLLRDKVEFQVLSAKKINLKF